jgi:hypothetical protein
MMRKQHPDMCVKGLMHSNDKKKAIEVYYFSKDVVKLFYNA